MTNTSALEITVKNITEILTRRWDDAELAKREVDEILEEFQDEIKDGNVYNAIVTIEDLI